MRVKRDFYEQDTLTVSRQLLGKILVHETSEGVTRGMIVETEAYLGEADPASHSYKGKSERVRVQYGEAGQAYIYLIYGMYYCMNITSGPLGKPEVVLIRALEPIAGVELMKLRRGTDKLISLCSGPGKLCMAMGIGKEQYGADLCGSGSPFYLEYGVESPEHETSKRVNIDYAGEARDFLWRYTLKGSRFLSK